jgi:hypothetical protein
VGVVGRFRSQEMNHMRLLLLRTGLRCDDNASYPGAQTERRSWAGPQILTTDGYRFSRRLWVALGLQLAKQFLEVFPCP